MDLRSVAQKQVFDHSGMRAVVEDFWIQLISKQKPFKYLEIGSFEGLSASLFLHIAATYANQEDAPRLELTCIDNWIGGEEHQNIDFSCVEKMFDQNINICLDLFTPNNRPLIKKLKSDSSIALSSMVGQKNNSFDLIYIDGSHHSADVLTDLVLSWFLLRLNGILILDDYLWKEPNGKGAIHEPKMAIDCFTTIFNERLEIVPDSPLRQIYLIKTKN